MKLLTQILCLCLAAAVCFTDMVAEEPTVAEVSLVDTVLEVEVAVEAEEELEVELDRCDGIEMDSATSDGDNAVLFFKGLHVFKGTAGMSEPMNGTIEEVDGLNHTDAAFIMEFDPHSKDYDHTVFFQDHQVFRFNQNKLVDGYPKNITEDFPGIPDNLDAAVECPKVDCGEDYVIFIKGSDVYHFNIQTKAIDSREFETMPNCTSALRLIDSYYCFVGEQFSKFNPKTGTIHSRYPKAMRDYFMKCHTSVNCSEVHLNAISSHGNDLYAFRDDHFVHKDLLNDVCSRSQICEGGDTTPAPIESMFPEVKSGVDAVFNYNNQFYMTKDQQMFCYIREGENTTLVEGYPVPVMEELGIEGRIDAAFVCDDDPDVHFMKGDTLYGVDMRSGTPRNVTSEVNLPLFPEVDAILCSSDGMNVIVGHSVYHFANKAEMIAATVLPEANEVSKALFNCFP